MIFKELALKTQSDASGSDLFGTSLSSNMEGDLFVVGASGHSSNRGAVYVYQRDSAGVITLLQKITASDSQQGDKFGHSVRLSASGNVLAVGSPQCSGVNGRTLHGAVYVYFWNGSSFSNEFKVIPNGGTSPTSGSLNNTYFGYDVALSYDGSTLVVGNDAESEDGCIVYVYSNSGINTFTFSQTLQNPRRESYVSKFGKAVAIDRGQTVVVGCPDLAASNSPDFSQRLGGGFIFQKNDTFTLTSSIYFSTFAAQFRKFGESVAVNHNGTVCCFGAPETLDVGFVGIYLNTSPIAEPNFVQRGFIIQSPDEQVNLGFGKKIQVDHQGHRLMVGMDSSVNTTGKIWMFEFYSGLNRELDDMVGERVWEVETPSFNQADQKFGSAICLSPNGLIALVGSPNYEGDGSFYAYRSRVNVRHFSYYRNRVNQNDEFNIPYTTSRSNETDLETNLDFIPPISKIAQKMTMATLHPSSVALAATVTGSPLGSIKVEIIAGDLDGPYDNPEAVLCSSELPVTGGFNFPLPTPYIFENDQYWLVISGDAEYLTSSDNSNYISFSGFTPASLPCLKYENSWSPHDISLVYDLISLNTYIGVGEYGRLSAAPFDFRNSIYTMKSAPYQINGGEKLIFEKNGNFRQTLTLPTPAIAGQMTQQELVDFINENLDPRFRCTAVAQTVDGKPVVVLRNDDIFLSKSNVTEAAGFLRVDTEWNLATNGTVATNDALAFSNGITMWAMKPDVMKTLDITDQTAITEWYDWFENIHKPLQQKYWSNYDREVGEVTFRPKLGIYPLEISTDVLIGGDDSMKWNLRSLFTFVVNNFILNPQTKKARNSVGDEISINLDADKNHINIVIVSFFEDRRYWSAFWYY